MSLTALAITAPSHAFSPVREERPIVDAGEAGAATATSLADTVERVSPSVVQIIVRQPSDVRRLSGPSDFDGIPQEFRKFFVPEFGFDFGEGFSPGGKLPDRLGSGSGFFIEGGYIVTNNHVVDHAKKLTVRFDDGTEVDGNLVGTDEKTDLAVVKVDAGRARKPLQWGNSDRSRVGDNVFTIGAPFSLGNTVTAGIISARGRDISSGPYDDYFQIDAPINPGNSGGPMFNNAGQVIGVNTAIYSPSGGNVGIGFSIPSDQAQSVVRQIIDHGHVERGWLGVNIQKVTPEIAQSMGLESAKGALVSDVTSGSPAEKAGLKPKDVILGFGGMPIAAVHDLTRAVAETKPGSTQDLKVYRNGHEQTMPVKISALESSQPGKTSTKKTASSGSVTLEGLGLQVTEDKKGLTITDVDDDTEAADAGLRPGDLVQSVNDREIRSANDASQALAEARAKHREAVLIGVKRNGSKLYFGVRLTPS
ncbi:MAG TPA: Do family serine endopeptidase [Hyphomonadaceae bacterium]|nr:Do family serine endopeptidase [Hyphomonadaceae bacterium]